MQFAVNYSEPLARLLQEGTVTVDLIKCPAWPDLIGKALQLSPCYVHLPLNVGGGFGDAFNSETRKKVDWDFIEDLLVRTNTPIINVHLSPWQEFNQDVENDPWSDAAYERIFEKTIHDLEGVVRRWGKEMVIAENPFPDPKSISVNSRPDFVKEVVETLDIGFLFDISHSRLAARKLGMGEEEYLLQLPLDRTKEIHVTGIKRLEGEWAEKLLRNRPKEFNIEEYLGREIDHQSLSEDDFCFLERIYRMIENDVCCKPWVSSLEHGGIGPFWELSLDDAVLAEQLPRLYNMTHSIKLEELV